MNWNVIDSIVRPVRALSPAAAITSESAINCLTIQQSALSDRYEEVLFVLQSGAIGGAPDSTVVTMKVQQSSDDGATDAYADVTDLALVEAATKTLTAANTVQTLAAKLSGLKDYVRLVAAPDFTGGTSPSIFLSGLSLLGRPRRA